MKNLGIKDRMYPSTVESKEPEIRYPSVSLPLSMLNKKDIDLDDEVVLKFKGKITRVEKSKWSKDFSVELKEGEIEEEKGTLLG